MAIFHFHQSYIGRSSVGSACSHSAYISADVVQDQRSGQKYNYVGKIAELLATGILAPHNAPSWVYDAESLWNAVEQFEDAIAEERFRGHSDPIKNDKSLWAKQQFLESCKTAYKAIIALPIEIDNPEHLKQLAIQLTQKLYVERGLVAQYAIHLKDGNPHLHIQAATRPLDGDVFSKRRWACERSELKLLRQQCADVTNEFAKSHGYNYQVDARSYKDQGLDIVPTHHRGYHADQLIRCGLNSRIVTENNDIQDQNINLFLKHPEQLVQLVATRRPVFTRKDLEWEVLKRVAGDTHLFTLMQQRLNNINLKPYQLSPVANDNIHYDGQAVVQALQLQIPSVESAFKPEELAILQAYVDHTLQHPATVRLGEDIRWQQTYTSAVYQQLESSIEKQVQHLYETRQSAIKQPHIVQAIEATTQQKSTLTKSFEFAQEQLAAINHLLSDQQLQMLTGRAGTGKSTVLKPVVKAYESSGRTVWGAAFQGKVADALSRELGIEAFTLDQLKYHWDTYQKSKVAIQSGSVTGKARSAALQNLQRSQAYQLSSHHVVIVDEANMVSGNLWQALLTEVIKSGATLRIVGDNNQIKPLFGGDFSGLIEKNCGSLTLTEVHRQRLDWMKNASVLLNDHKVAEGLKCYLDQARIHFKSSAMTTEYQLLSDYMQAYKAARPTERVNIKVLAYLNKTVENFNQAIRFNLQQQGELTGPEFTLNNQLFAVGEQVMFTQNDHTERLVHTLKAGQSSSRGVKNGSVGTIENYDPAEHNVKVRLQDDRLVAFNTQSYQGLTYAYALTVNKSEGETYHRTFAYFDLPMDPNSLLIMLTRHIFDCHTYVNQEQAIDLQAMVQALGRSDYRPMIYDTQHNDRLAFETARAYLESCEYVSGLMDEIVSTLPAGQDVFDHPDWQDVMLEQAKRRELATQIMEDWGRHAPFLQQTGWRRRTVEIHAELQKRLLSDVEIAALKQVENYYQTCLDARALWQQIILTHPGGMASGHPLYNEYDHCRQQRDQQAAEIAAFAPLYRPFFRLNKIEDNKFKGYGLKIYDCYPSSFKTMLKQAESYQRYSLEQQFMQRLTGEEQDQYQQLKQLKNFHHQATAAYHHSKETQDNALATKTQLEQWQQQSQHMSAQRDLLAYALIEKCSPRDQLCTTLKLEPTVVLKWASLGEVRQHLALWQQATTLDDRLQQAEILLKLLPSQSQMPGNNTTEITPLRGRRQKQQQIIDQEAYKLSGQFYVLLKEQQVDIHQIRFEAGVKQVDQQHVQSITDLISLRQAYSSFDTYRAQHKAVHQQWQMIRSDIQDKIIALQQAQVDTLRSHAKSNMVKYDRLQRQTLKQLKLQAVNSNVHEAINERLKVAIGTLHSEGSTALLLNDRQTQLEQLTDLIDQRPSVWQASPLLAAQAQEWQHAWQHKAALAGQALQAWGPIIAIHCDDDFKRMVREDQQLFAPEGMAFKRLQRQVQAYRATTNLTDKLALNTALYQQVMLPNDPQSDQGEQLHKAMYHRLKTVGMPLAQLRFERAYLLAVDSGQQAALPNFVAASRALEHYRMIHTSSAYEWRLIKNTTQTLIKNNHQHVRAWCQQQGFKLPGSDAVQTAQPDDLKAINHQLLSDLQRLTLVELQKPQLTQFKQDLHQQQIYLQQGQTGMLNLYRTQHTTDWTALRDQKITLAGQWVTAYADLLPYLPDEESKRLVKEAHQAAMHRLVVNFTQATNIDKIALGVNIQQILEDERTRNVRWLVAALENQHVAFDEIRLYAVLGTLDDSHQKQTVALVTQYVEAQGAWQATWRQAEGDATLEIADKKLLYDDYKQSLIEALTSFSPGPPHYPLERLERQVTGWLDVADKLGAPLNESRVQDRLAQVAQQQQWTLNAADSVHFTNQVIQLSKASRSYFTAKAKAMYRGGYAEDLQRLGKERQIAAFNLVSQAPSVVQQLVEKEDYLGDNLHHHALRFALAKPQLQMDHPHSAAIKSYILQRYNSGDSILQQQIVKALQGAKINPQIWEIGSTLTHNYPDNFEAVISSKILSKVDSKPVATDKSFDVNAKQQHKPQPLQYTKRHYQPRERYDIDTILRHINEHDITTLAQGYAASVIKNPKMRRHGQQLRFGSGGGLVVNAETGIWFSHYTSDGGTIFDLVAELEGLSKGDAIRWLGEYIDAPKDIYIDAAEVERRHQAALQERQREQQERLTKGIQKTTRIHNSSRPIAGTLAEKYLRQHRGISADLPADIRFIAEWQDFETKQHYPALVSFARNAEGVMTSCQTILLNPDTGAKAQDITTVKRTHGALKGSAVCVQAGDGVTYIVEGLETALSLKVAGLQGEILVSYGQSNLRNAPASNAQVVVCGDYDGTNQNQTRQHMDKTVAHLQERGYQVEVVWPGFQGAQKCDFNDILKQDGVSAIQQLLKEQLPDVVNFTNDRLKDLSVAPTLAGNTEPQTTANQAVPATNPVALQQTVKPQLAKPATSPALEPSQQQAVEQLSTQSMQPGATVSLKPLEQTKAPIDLKAERYLELFQTYNGLVNRPDGSNILQLRVEFEARRFDALIENYSEQMEQAKPTQIMQAALRHAKVEGRFYQEHIVKTNIVPDFDALFYMQAVRLIADQHQQLPSQVNTLTTQLAPHNLSSAQVTAIANNCQSLIAESGRPPDANHIDAMIRGVQLLDDQGIQADKYGEQANYKMLMRRVSHALEFRSGLPATLFAELKAHANAESNQRILTTEQRQQEITRALEKEQDKALQFSL